MLRFQPTKSVATQLTVGEELRRGQDAATLSQLSLSPAVSGG